jgi:hypothetical protein
MVVVHAVKVMVATPSDDLEGTGARVDRNRPNGATAISEELIPPNEATAGPDGGAGNELARFRNEASAGLDGGSGHELARFRNEASAGLDGVCGLAMKLRNSQLPATAISEDPILTNMRNWQNEANINLCGLCGLTGNM